MLFHLLYFILLLQYSQPKEVESRPYQLFLNCTLSKEILTAGIEDVKSFQNTVFIDSRTIEEFEVSHIKDAIFLAYKDPNLYVLNEVDKDETIVVYCSVGSRSEETVIMLKSKGYSNVYNLFGGIFEWKNRNLKVYNNTGNETDSIHAYNKAWSIWLKNGIIVY